MVRYNAQDTEGMSARLLALYANASDDDRASGLAWYGRARAAAEAMAAQFGTSVDTACGVIAALSPRVQWAPNLQGASDMLAAASLGEAEPTVAGLGANRAKAWRIANGESPASVLGGPKVTAFYANIVGDHSAVTVDVWAARAAEGESNPVGPTGARYNRIAAAYQAAAASAGVSPRTLQAAVWTYVRGAAEGNFRPSLARIV